MNFDKIFSLGLLLCALLVSAGQNAEAQKVEDRPSSKSGFEVQSGVTGVESDNKSNSRFPKAVKNYKEQIRLLTNKGNLSIAKAKKFNTRLAELERLVKDAEAKQWTESSVKDLDKKFKEFTRDLSAHAPVAQPIEWKKQRWKAPTIIELDEVPPAPQAAPSSNSTGLDDASSDGRQYMLRRSGRRPNVGGGDTKPTGAAGKSN